MVRKHEARIVERKVPTTTEDKTRSVEAEVTIE